MDTERRNKLVAKLRGLEAEYNALRSPAVIQGLRDAAFTEVVEIFQGSVIKPEAAAFVVGRIFQALAAHRRALLVILEYESIERTLAGMAEADVAAQQNVAAQQSAFAFGTNHRL